MNDQEQVMVSESRAVPDDVLKAASRFATVDWAKSKGQPSMTRAIARAIMAERERCLRDVAAYKDYDGSTGIEYDNGYTDAHNDALTAIRKGEA